MTFTPTLALYLALTGYALGTIVALLTLFVKETKLQRAALHCMLAGFVAHTVWIGTICTRTGHPPITNLPETASFIAWTIFVVELVLYIRYRVHAASFIAYPLILILLTIAAVIHEDFAKLDPSLRSSMFTAHLLFSTVGVAALMIGLVFTILAYLQDRALKSKTRGPLWDWIPSLSVCKTVSYRALAIGFSIYTIGLLMGFLWSYRTAAGLMLFRSKQIGALVAWGLFAVLLQSYISGSYKARRTFVLSLGAFAAIVVAIFGIQHG